MEIPLGVAVTIIVGLGLIPGVWLSLLTKHKDPLNIYDFLAVTVMFPGYCTIIAGIACYFEIGAKFPAMLLFTLGLTLLYFLDLFFEKSKKLNIQRGIVDEN